MIKLKPPLWLIDLRFALTNLAVNLLHALKRLCLVLVIALGGALLVLTPASAAELVSFSNATLVDTDFNDGDSFQVQIADRKLHVRLYYVDCPETKTYGHRAMLERIRQQQRHFGLPDANLIVKFGEQAALRTRQWLAKPFTVHTSYAKTPRSTSRYYAFIETADGDDLAHLLVAHGLARIHGKTRATTDGTPSETVLQELQALRAAAMLKRSGIWRTTNPDLLIKMRGRQRGEEHELETLKQALHKPRNYNDPPLNLNTATTKQLQQIAGIGPVTAAKIIIARPYQSVNDLLRIHGISEKTVKRISPYVTVK